MRPVFRRSVAALVLGTAVVASPAFADDRPILLAHLPDSPASSALRLAEGIGALEDALEARLEVDLRVEIFRRRADALAFAREAAPIAIVLGEAAFVRELGGVRPLRPVARLLLRDRDRFRKLLVKRTGGRALTAAAAHTIALSETETAAGRAEALALWPAGGAPPTLLVRPDDFHATAAAIFGESAAAWVADYNPLLVEHLGDDLELVAVGEERETPLLALGEGGSLPPLLALLSGLPAADRTVDRALDAALEGLGATGFGPIEPARERFRLELADLEPAGLPAHLIPMPPPVARAHLAPLPLRIPWPVPDWEGLLPPE